MEKIRNKKFIDYLRSQDKEIQAERKDATRGDVLKSFENNIEKLETLVEKRINNKKDEDSGPYNNIKFLLRRYINATKSKFIVPVSFENTKLDNKGLSPSKSRSINTPQLGPKEAPVNENPTTT